MAARAAYQDINLADVLGHPLCALRHSPAAVASIALVGGNLW